jgi:hypothetical protein
LALRQLLQRFYWIPTLSNNVFGPEGTLDIKVEFKIMQAPVTMNGNQVGQVMAAKVMHHIPVEEEGESRLV